MIQRLLHVSAQAGRSIYLGKEPFSVLAGIGGKAPAAPCDRDPFGCGLHMFGYTAGLLAPIERDGAVVMEIDDLERLVQIAGRRWWEHARAVGFVTGTFSAGWPKLGERLRLLQVHAASITTALGQLAAIARRENMVQERVATVTRIAAAAVSLLDVWMGIVSDLAAVPPGAELMQQTRVALKVVEAALDVYTRIANREYAHVYVGVALAAAALIDAKLGGELHEKVRQYLPFVAEIAAARTADDVKRTLESFAAPVGAGRAKRGADRRTIALTALVGGTGGWEWTHRLGRTWDGAAQAGLFAPVGIDVSRGVGESFSVGGFLSLVDIGALTTFREEREDMASGTTVESTPQVGFKQVFSPGLYVVLGWDRWAFGAGASLGPELRKISMDGTVVENATSLRFGVFAAIDVTIFPF